LLAHVELLIHRYPQVLLLRAALEPLSAQPLLMFGIALTDVQDLALDLVELHAVCTGPPLQLVQVPLNDIPSLQLSTTPHILFLLSDFETAHVNGFF